MVDEAMDDDGVDEDVVGGCVLTVDSDEDIAVVTDAHGSAGKRDN